MQGSFSEEILELYRELAFQFSEVETQYDFTRCVRPNGTVYGTSGKCRKGREEAKTEEKLFQKGSKVNITELEKRAEEWRKEAGLKAEPGTVDWKHDRVHALVHDFLGGSDKIGKWTGEGSKSPTAAEEVLVNLIHRDAALKARGEEKLDDSDLAMYISRDIQVIRSRRQMTDEDLNKYDYMKTDKDRIHRVNYERFIEKYKEMRNTPGYENLLDAAHASWTEAGDVVL